jgi:hypothetical protein
MVEENGGHRPDWEFSFVDAVAVPAALETLGPHARELSFVRATLAGDISALTRTCLHGQSLLRKYASEGVPDDELAVYSGLSIEHVRRVIAGEPMLETLFGP